MADDDGYQYNVQADPTGVYDPPPPSAPGLTLSSLNPLNLLGAARRTPAGRAWGNMPYPNMIDPAGGFAPRSIQTPTAPTPTPTAPTLTMPARPTSTPLPMVGPARPTSTPLPMVGPARPTSTDAATPTVSMPARPVTPTPSYALPGGQVAAQQPNLGNYSPFALIDAPNVSPTQRSRQGSPMITALDLSALFNRGEAQPAAAPTPAAAPAARPAGPLASFDLSNFPVAGVNTASGPNWQIGPAQKGMGIASTEPYGPGPVQGPKKRTTTS